VILINAFAKPLRNGQPNPKNYPFWNELIPLLNSRVEQIGIQQDQQLVPIIHKDLALDQLKQLILDCSTWIACDSFFQHYAWHVGKPGVVLWGQSDPLIFGHDSNINLLKDRSYLRANQFWLWEQAEYRTDCWVSPQEVAAAVNSRLEK
jgi:hypothetical protein